MYISFTQTFPNTQSFTCIKGSSSIPGLSNGAFILLPGKLKQTLSEPTKATMVSAAGAGSGCTGNSPRLSTSTPHLEISPFAQTQRSSPLHFTDKRQNPRRTPQETACGQAWETSSFMPPPSEPRTYQFLGLS